MIYDFLHLIYTNIIKISIETQNKKIKNLFDLKNLKVSKKMKNKFFNLVVILTKNLLYDIYSINILLKNWITKVIILSDFYLTKFSNTLPKKLHKIQILYIDTWIYILVI